MMHHSKIIASEIMGVKRFLKKMHIKVSSKDRKFAKFVKVCYYLNVVMHQGREGLDWNL